MSNHVTRLRLADIPEGLLEVWADGVPDADLDAYAQLLNVEERRAP
ncbi:hypothetical protein ACFQDE_20980 [Deinococcus caeni]|uniref:Uncharacterized protein n=1 Tax=Deinococcus caeni TaxID=569127 RepID=A0ABP9UGV3_9DEIO